MSGRRPFMDPATGPSCRGSLRAALMIRVSQLLLRCPRRGLTCRTRTSLASVSGSGRNCSGWQGFRLASKSLAWSAQYSKRRTCSSVDAYLGTSGPARHQGVLTAAVRPGSDAGARPRLVATLVAIGAHDPGQPASDYSRFTLRSTLRERPRTLWLGLQNLYSPVRIRSSPPPFSPSV